MRTGHEGDGEGETGTNCKPCGAYPPQHFGRSLARELFGWETGTSWKVGSPAKSGELRTSGGWRMQSGPALCGAVCAGRPAMSGCLPVGHILERSRLAELSIANMAVDVLNYLSCGPFTKLRWSKRRILACCPRQSRSPANLTSLLRIFSE